MRKSVTFEVVGRQRIACDGCEQRIEKLLKSVPGVDKARASMRSQRIEVLFDGTAVNANALAARIGTAGYQTKLVSY